ncbi:hypothetical protein CEXT_646021 [Caerostris extrusa]|uniref:Uncharacterized protein n=1 Tax=Caerostris extrusa TaxID=172846 RepID=A0AAV4MEJ8_CAEEX|nr:hypothetical protein CEXT_646021 [Caerostris extrusa]
MRTVRRVLGLPRRQMPEDRIASSTQVDSFTFEAFVPKRLEADFFLPFSPSPAVSSLPAEIASKKIVIAISRGTRRYKSCTPSNREGVDWRLKCSGFRHFASARRFSIVGVQNIYSKASYNALSTIAGLPIQFPSAFAAVHGPIPVDQHTHERTLSSTITSSPPSSWNYRVAGQ